MMPGIIAMLPTFVAASVVLPGLLLLLAYAVSAFRPQLANAATLPVPASLEQASPAERARQEARARALLERWSPNFAQQVSTDHPERDRPLAINFDGDWAATNNWTHLT